MAAAMEELQKLQTELDELEEGQAESREALEASYFKQCQPLFERRRRLVKGDVEPTDEEAPPEEEGEDTSNDANANIKKKRGVPAFWLRVLKNQDVTSEYVKKRDEDALEYLEEISCRPPPGGGIGYRLEFHFAPNPFFHDSLLVREIDLPYAGAPLSKASSKDTPGIRWKGTENNLTLKIVAKAVKKPKGNKGKDKGKDKQPQRETSSPASAAKTKPCESFFTFFDVNYTPGPGGGRGGKKQKKEGSRAERSGEGDGEEEEEELIKGRGLLDEELELELEGDGEEGVPEEHLEILEAIRNEVVPNAVEWYVSGGFAAATKEAVEEDDAYEVVGQQEGGLENLPSEVRRRVKALQYLHQKKKAAQQEHARGVAKLRDSLEKAAAGVYARRKGAVCGKALDSGRPEDMAVEKFWLLALKGCSATVELIRKRDEGLLACLADVRYRTRTEGPGFHIDFEFLRQCKLWMENRVLTKTYVFTEEGGDLLRSESTPILWQEDMDVTIRSVQSGKGTKNKPCPSFFHMFDEKRTHLLFSGDDAVQLTVGELRSRETEVATALRDVVVPQALEVYGAATQWADEDEDDDDEDDDDEDDDEDDEADGQKKVGGSGRRGGKKGRRGRKGTDEDIDIVCCGLSRNTGLLLLLLLIFSSQAFVYLDTILLWLNL
eukprot:TRINITY_DN374_c1_g3_i1.p1 TRINITY_DN374_c1_g3~~TRINITY_DN374_c1_g3_i1.p1  ORF type:complete len:663 (+),score=184.26 TRINITY_DN374_c1_g3_i1:187-2175(+)